MNKINEEKRLKMNEHEKKNTQDPSNKISVCMEQNRHKNVTK